MLENFTVLSPHLDDAIWSLGGYLKMASARGNIRVINIFSQHNFAYGEMVDPEVATKIRKHEDTIALNSAGITDIHYLDFPEALLRGYSFDQMFLETETELHDSAASDLEINLRRLIVGSDTILIPACFGGHVDHVVTRDVAVKLPGNHFFYEDLPYAARDVRRSIAEDFLKSKRRITEPSTLEGLEEHSKLIQLYKSQIAERHSIQINQYIKEEGFNLWN